MKRSIYIISIGVLISSVVATASEEKLASEFRQICAEKAAAANAADTMTIVGREGWMFLANELRHISVGEFFGEAAMEVSKATKPDRRDPLPAILDFKAGLERVGIELLVVPVPPKAIVYPDMLDGKLQAEADGQTPRLDLYHQNFYKLLQEQGVAVLDLVPAFTAARLDEKGDAYCKQDSHWSGRGCEITAQQIAERLKDRPWLEAAQKQSLVSEVREMKISGDLWNAAKGTKPPKEKLSLRVVGTKDSGMLQPVPPDRSSPVILMGDSHTLVFHVGEDMHARGAGLADQLANEFGFAVDLIGVRGSGASPTRITLFRRCKDPNYLKSKKLLIWCLSAREFTEAVTGWRVLPVVK